MGNLSQAGTRNNVKIVVPLKYLSNISRSSEMPLINCRLELSLRWIENCVLTTAAIGALSATFKITDAKLNVPVVTLSAEDNAILAKQLDEGFKRPVYWNKYKVIDNKRIEIARTNEEKPIRELLDSSYQGVKRLFVLPCDDTEGDDQVSVDSKTNFFQEKKLQH